MFSSIADIEDYLQELVPKTFQMKFTGEKGIAQTKTFLEMLGSPQNKLRIVHIAGTSGKGSTSFMVSKLLESQGFKVGLHLSPHLLDIRERMQINNTFLSEKRFIRYFTEVAPFIEKMRDSEHGDITYFIAVLGLAYYVFAKEKVDYAVMETGCGGEFDGTNVVERKGKLSIITKIGFDHMNILGNTLSKIAHQKAMICQEDGELISIYQLSSAGNEIKRVVESKHARLFMVETKDIRNISLSQTGSQFTFFCQEHVFKNIQLGMIGKHQVENASLALTALYRLSKTDHFLINETTMRHALKDIHFKGRLDIVRKPQGGSIVLDGAHNTQKMRTLLKAINTLFSDKKLTFVIAFKKGKEYIKMVRQITPYAKKVIITQIFSQHQDLLTMSEDPEGIGGELRKLHFTNVIIKRNIFDVIELIKKDKESYIVTGSLYLLGDIYKLL